MTAVSGHASALGYAMPPLSLMMIDAGDSARMLSGLSMTLRAPWGSRWMNRPS
jgi:hypothetical protein